MKSCAITGYRPTRFEFKYKEESSGCRSLKSQLNTQFMSLYERGVRDFYVGGALGVDMWAAEILLRLKEKPGYEGLGIHVALPCSGYNDRWDERSQRRMDFIIRHSKSCIIAGTSDCSEGYMARNRYMVSRADCLLAVCNSLEMPKSGTLYTVRYARRKGLPICFVDPDTAMVRWEGLN